MLLYSYKVPYNVLMVFHKFSSHARVCGKPLKSNSMKTVIIFCIAIRKRFSMHYMSALLVIYVQEFPLGIMFVKTPPKTDP